MTRLFVHAVIAAILGPWIIAFAWMGCEWCAEALRERRTRLNLAAVAQAHANMQTAGW